MDSMNAAVNAVNDVLWSYVLIVVLIACGLYFTFATRFVQVRMLPEMLRLLTEGIGKQTEGHAISSFQAFCVSTASRVGVGNIAGVAIAIVTGGPGAVFWMWLIAFIGCATGFVESTLAQIYKLPRGNGKFHGGPAYYIKNALHQPGVAKLFALLISVTFGLVYVSVQANTIALSAQTIGIDPAITAAFLCIFTALGICGGMHRIAKVTEFLVPIMAGLYLLVALVIILLHLSEVPAMFALIFHDAFSPQAAVGGGLGTAMITGIKRGLFSNEAGEGSVPNAAATAAVTHPVKQGLVQSFGVYVDTWIVCSATAFIILLTGQYTIGGECTGIALAHAAVSLMILLFAFSSIVGNYYYGEINIAFFDGNTRRYLAVFRVCVVLMVLFGSLATLQLVWNLADLFMGLLCLTNLYAITRLAPYARRALIDYQEKRAHGEDPSFTASDIDLTDGIYAWKK